MSYKLEKPYIEKQRADFIVAYNYTKGLRIEETSAALYALEAWELLDGDRVIDNTESYKTEQLTKAKYAKTQEATDKAYSFESKDALITVSATNMMSRSSETYHIEATLTNNIKLSAYAQALDETSVLPWNTKENVNVLLNKAACTALTSLMSQLNAKLWTVDFPTFLAQIEAAQTVEDVEAIEIVYPNPQEVIDVNIPPTVEEDGGADSAGDEPAGSTEQEETPDENTPDTDVPEVQEDTDIPEDAAGEVE